MAAPPGNPNLYRRPALGLALALAWPALKVLSRLLARRGTREGGGLVVFQSYQVGDFFMALPAILRLSRHMPVTVLCRPDCVFAFKGTGVEALGLHCPFISRSSPSALWRSLRNAWALRGRISGAALDFEADPRAAFFLRVAGLHPLTSYARSFAWLFDETLALPPGARHQGQKNDALVEAFLAKRGLFSGIASSSEPPPAGPAAASGTEAGSPVPAGVPAGASVGGLLVSCWTRKDTKNWPFEHWDRLLDHLAAARRPLAVIVPPDGDKDFQAFRGRWEGRVEFLAGDLETVFAAAMASAGIVATDNFLGHMAAYLDKPVLWINGSSDPEHVAPRGVRTAVVQVETMPCRPCRHRCVNPVYKQCLKELRPEAVIAAAETWLRGLR